ncbi:glycoside hydrolase family 92 protein [Amanita muscaria Koide BX008]|uniref:Glycoside hydrolase family 92 protein n=1 Tax=Amanita muscaria (strain Koide BX008) TaxID=946122 RepID=A0A0C2X3L6_AMAMK|nr:glycoside hydrolase family 92 protein [Amanita muscaria Koide BX008]
MPYVKSLTINGEVVTWPVIRHDQIADGGHIVFEVSDKPEEWGNALLWKSVSKCYCDWLGR